MSSRGIPILFFYIHTLHSIIGNLNEAETVDQSMHGTPEHRGLPETALAKEGAGGPCAVKKSDFQLCRVPPPVVGDNLRGSTRLNKGLNKGLNEGLNKAQQGSTRLNKLNKGLNKGLNKAQQD